MRVAAVRDISEQVRGVTYAKSEASAVPRSGYSPVLRANNIGEHGLLLEDLIFVPNTKISRKQRIVPNDVVVAASSGSLSVVGKTTQVRTGFSGGFGAFCKVLRPGPDVDPYYFGHYFKTASYRRIVSRLASGVNINNLKKEHLDNLQVPLPPLTEQRRIARILDAANALRTKRREALAQLDTLLQSTFLDMFGDPVTNPMGWPVGALRSLGQVTTGGTPPSAKEGMFDGEIPFITPGALESDQPIKRTVTDAGAQASRTVGAGATLVCCIGATIGKIGKSTVRSAFNQQINGVEWGERMHAEYGYAVMRFFKPTIIARGTSTTLPILKKSSFQRIEIPVPPLSVQHQFAAIVESVERQKASQRAHLAELDTLFASLQSRAFRGDF